MITFLSFKRYFLYAVNLQHHKVFIFSHMIENLNSNDTFRFFNLVIIKYAH
jgi:hypothetical protein